MSSTTTSPAATRVSLSRLGIVLLAVALVGWVGVRTISEAVATHTPPGDTWFAPYVDVTATPSYPFETPGGPWDSTVVLAFVVSGAEDPCSPYWGGVYSLDSADSDLQLDRRLAQLRLTGGNATVSFGGQRGTELATGCDDVGSLTRAYRSVIERYGLDAIDLDLEGSTLTDSAATARRATAVRDLQSAQRSAGRDLAVWLTLPVSRDGLSDDGVAMVDALLAAGVDLAGVNGMTMDFGTTATAEDPESAAVAAAATALHGQVQTAFASAGDRLDETAAWGRVGLTPMIGQSDVAGEQFTLADAAVVNQFARAKGVGRLSMWSLNRDATCRAPLPSVLGVVQTSCSGIDQGAESFAEILGSATAQPTVSPSTSGAPTPVPSASDDPAHGPFPVWDPVGTYPGGSRVVWHHQVFQARYWTTGFSPDTPGSSSADNPWTLIGPVLPGDTPAPLPSVADGTFPQWNPTVAYPAGSRVQVGSTPYAAKWWSQGQRPGEPVAGGSPWLLVVPGA